MATKTNDYYVHANFSNYLTYSINYNDHDKVDFDPEQIMSDQIDEVIRHGFENKKYQKIDCKDLEDKLNQFFAFQRGELVDGNITQKDIDLIQQAFVQHMGQKLKGLTLDPKTLSAINNGYDLTKIANELDESTKTALLKLGKLESLGQGETGRAEIARIKDRLDYFEKLYNAIGQKSGRMGKLRQDIENLQRAYNDLLITAERTSGKGAYFRTDAFVDGKRPSVQQYGATNKFMDDLNNLVKQVKLYRDAAISGSYAEYMTTAIAPLLLSGKVYEGIDDINAVIAKRLKGDKKTARGINNQAWLNVFIAADELTKQKRRTRQAITKDGRDEEGNYFTTQLTSDKVDFTLEFNDEEYNISMKNYDMSNLAPGLHIHFLTGRSVFELLQNDQQFLFHYMNINAEHPAGDDSTQVQLERAKEAMRLTILLKAIEGGVYGKRGDTIGIGDTVDLVIINDKSKGEYKVYTIGMILDKVQKKVDLITTGDLDKERLKNDWVGDEEIPNFWDARRRITAMIMKLDSMALDVSVDKKVFTS